MKGSIRLSGRHFGTRQEPKAVKNYDMVKLLLYLRNLMSIGVVDGQYFDEFSHIPLTKRDIAIMLLASETVSDR